MHAKVLLVLISVLGFETYMMATIKETSPTMEEPSCEEEYESTNLTYNVTLDSLGSSDRPSWFNDTVMNKIKAAFEYWARESSLEFKYWPYGPKVNITIEFTSNQSACGVKTFGKRNGKLGCTKKHLPIGKVYLDMAEDWTINDFRGTNIFQLATHHIGHVLGLNHSECVESVMQAKHPGNRKYYRTAPNDIRAIRKLYGCRKGRKHIDDESLVYEVYVPCLSKTKQKRLLESKSYEEIQEGYGNTSSNSCLYDIRY